MDMPTLTEDTETGSGCHPLFASVPSSVEFNKLRKRLLRQARQAIDDFAMVKPGDVIEVREKSKQLVTVLEAVQLAERDVPDYIEADHNKMVVKYGRIPGLSDVPYAVQMEPNLVVEFYSR